MRAFLTAVLLAVPAAPPPEPVAVKYGPLSDLAFARDGRLLAIRDHRLLRVRRSGRLRSVRPLARDLATAAFGPGGRPIAEVLQRRVRVRGAFSTRIPYSPSGDVHAFWSPDGRRLLVETEGGNLVLDARTGRRLRRLRVSPGYLGRQPFSPDGLRIARHHLLDRASWSPDGRHLAGDTADGVAIVEVASGRVTRFDTPRALEVAWSPDSRQIAAYGAPPPGPEWAVWVTDVATGKMTVVHRFAEGEERGELAWSPDGRRLAFQVAEPL